MRKEKTVLKPVCICNMDFGRGKGFIQKLFPLEKIIPGRNGRMENQARICFVRQGDSPDGHDKSFLSQVRMIGFACPFWLA